MKKSKSETSSKKEQKGEIVIYRTPAGKVSVDVTFNDDTFWLTQKAMAELFGVGVPAISKHIKNIYEEGELQENSTVSKMETVVNRGFRGEVSEENVFWNMEFFMFRLSKLTLFLTLLFVLMTFSAYSQAGHWEQLHPANSPSGRFGYGMATISDKKVLLFGGEGLYNNLCCDRLSDTWLFDFDTKEWSQLYPKISPDKRYGHRMCQISDNIVLMFGGDDDGFVYYDETWIFNLTDTSWTKLDLSMHPSARTHIGLSKISENVALLFGGRDFNRDPRQDTWLFDYNKKEWKQVIYNTQKYPIPYYRIDPAIAQLKDGIVLLYGGYAEGYGGMLSDTWKFDLDSMKWHLIVTKGVKDSISASGISNIYGNNIILFGGLSYDYPELRDNTLLFEPKNDEWNFVNVNDKPPATTYIQLAKIEEGKVLLFGGWSYGNPFGDTWLFTMDGNDVKETESEKANFEITNPGNGSLLVIKYSAQVASPLSLSVHDLLGQTVFSTEFNPTGGTNEYHLELNNLPAGCYITTATANGSRYTTKLMIMRR